MRDNSIFFLKDWGILVSSLSPENQLVFWNLFTNYEYGTEQPCDNLIVNPIWTFIKFQLDGRRKSLEYLITEKTDVYIVKLSNPNESFVKIGITASIKNRIKDYLRLGFSVETIKIIECENRFKALEIESELHLKFKESIHVPNNMFGGYTECFSLKIITEI